MATGSLDLNIIATLWHCIRRSIKKSLKDNIPTCFTDKARKYKYGKTVEAVKQLPGHFVSDGFGPGFNFATKR